MLDCCMFLIYLYLLNLNFHHSCLLPLLSLLLPFCKTEPHTYIYFVAKHEHSSTDVTFPFLNVVSLAASLNATRSCAS